MPDLTLDEFRGLSEEQLKRVLQKEAMKAGFAEECSNDEEAALPDTFCGHSSESGHQKKCRTRRKQSPSAFANLMLNQETSFNPKPKANSGRGQPQYRTLATGKHFAGKS